MTAASAPRTQGRTALWIPLAIIYVVWGSTYLAIAIVVQTLPPLASAGLRFLLAGGALTLWLVASRGRGVLRVRRVELAAAALVGSCLILGGNGLVSLAERDVPSGLAALIVGSVPLWVLVYRLIGGDRIRRLAVAGIVVGFAGVAFLVLPSGISGTVAPQGLLMMIGSTLSWSWGSYMSSRLELPREPLVSTGLQMLFGGMGLTLAGALTGELARLDPARFAPSSLLALAYLVVFGSLVAFTSYTWLLQHAPVSTVATYAYVNPVVAVFLGALVLHESVNASILVGAALIIGAVAFIVREEATRTHAPAARATN
ncbi:MAG: EamA family transporter [Candidatus Limnocylindria bacterium]